MNDLDDLDLLARLTAGADMQTTHRDPEHHVRALRLVDGPMGVTGRLLDERDVSLLAPCGSALAATWNRATVEAVGELLGEQAAARDVDVLLGPNLNLSRSPAGGRDFEHFGEDPYLAGVLGAAWITGVQSKGVAACAKHLVCNDTETGRHGYDVQVDEQTLHEVYLAPFAAAARAGVWAMMAAYNKVNGRHCAEHHGLLTRVLREQWDWDGVVMSDWFGTHSTTASLTAGLDLEMPGPARYLGPAAAGAVRAGDVAASTVERAVERLALLSRRTAGRTAPTRPAAEARRVLHEAAADSFVLLKNDRTVLPLSDDTSVAVIGPQADEPAYQGAPSPASPSAPRSAHPWQRCARHSAPGSRPMSPALRQSPACPPCCLSTPGPQTHPEHPVSPSPTTASAPTARCPSRWPPTPGPPGSWCGSPNCPASAPWPTCRPGPPGSYGPRACSHPKPTAPTTSTSPAPVTYVC